MRDPKRIERILAKIKEIWLKSPDLRLTQLIMNTLKMNEDPYYVEDDILEKVLDEYSKITCENIKQE